ncbi:MAG: zinc-ribbon domain containing protein [Bacteroidota bacterium]|nr:zinc-ribbon domain containing protein [Bacteroidota bacterium]
MQRIGASICKDCGQPFVITAGELQLCEEKGYPQPKRCHECRLKHKPFNRERVKK